MTHACKLVDISKIIDLLHDDQYLQIPKSLNKHILSRDSDNLEAVIQNPRTCPTAVVYHHIVALVGDQLESYGWSTDLGPLIGGVELGILGCSSHRRFLDHRHWFDSPRWVRA